MMPLRSFHQPLHLGSQLHHSPVPAAAESMQLLVLSAVLPAPAGSPWACKTRVADRTRAHVPAKTRGLRGSEQAALCYGYAQT